MLSSFFAQVSQQQIKFEHFFSLLIVKQKTTTNAAKWSNSCTYALFVLASVFLMTIYFVLIPLNIFGFVLGTYQTTNRASTSISVVIIVFAVIGAILVLACMISVMCLLNNLRRLQRNAAAANANQFNPVYTVNPTPSPSAYPTMMPTNDN